MFIVQSLGNEAKRLAESDAVVLRQGTSKRGHIETRHVGAGEEECARLRGMS